ncbi:uncharacterized protein EDB93DRAFT_1102246 [Suillus bovinus]|uniref:uncharacterized protein n=1 Tax=Suillus bovinus TaxID=48563 RepID=UPI001B866238|nr:uncharacterized protein EDB93DRAFT_1102246 [Suillus bovinus]KAG2154474.1 hypothetical protein EDB93DRAFT_1102246 [Suillus bovinus]
MYYRHSLIVDPTVLNMHVPTLILSWFLHHSTQCSMHASKRRKGLSRKVHVSGFSYTGERRNEVLSQAAVAHECTAGLSQDTLNVLGEIRTELPHEDFIATDAMDHDGQNRDWEPIPESWNEDETIVHAIRDFVDHRWNYRVCKDTRTWRSHLDSLHANWMPILPLLADAFLHWKASNSAPPLTTPLSTEHGFTIKVVDLFTLESHAFIPCEDDILTSVALVNAGYVPYRQHYRTMLAGAFDVYLTMVHSIEKKVNVTLGRDTLNWWVLNACPPCAYALEDESPLTSNHMFVIDGGNLAKRMLQVGDRQRGDMREYADSDYMLPRPYVNQFANEVRSQPMPVDTSEPEDNWKAAAGEEKKWMWSIFDETGLFVAASVNLQSTLSPSFPKFSRFLVSCNLGAYDIGCGFTLTISSSSLGEAFKKQGCRSSGILASESIALDEAKRSLSISDDDLESWHAEEVDYFANVGKQSTVGCACYGVCGAPSKIERHGSSYSADLLSTRRLEMQCRYATEHLATLQHEVVSMEVTMGISHRWQPSTLEYQQTMEYMAAYKYQCALDQLQQLVVQRLFELQKLNISQTATLELNPPHAPLEWSRVSHYSFLEEFSLLWETRQDVREKPWAKPAVREVMRQWLRIKRAKEEIERCNVEVWRLHTAIIDEHQHFNLILNSLADNSLLKVAVEEFCACRCLINFQLLARISQIYALSGFTGVASPGTRKGVVLSHMEQDIESHNHDGSLWTLDFAKETGRRKIKIEFTGRRKIKTELLVKYIQGLESRKTAKIDEDTSPADAARAFLTSDAAHGVLQQERHEKVVTGFYSILFGFETGIFTTWKDCHQAVSGFQRPKYKKFISFAEAIAWMIMKGEVLNTLKAKENEMHRPLEDRTFASLQGTSANKNRNNCSLEILMGLITVLVDVDLHSETTPHHVHVELPSETPHRIVIPAFPLTSSPQSSCAWRTAAPAHSSTLLEASGTSKPRVYQAVRELSGVQSAHYEPPPHDDTPMPSFGDLADSYLQSHGFTLRAVLCIAHAVDTSKSGWEFIDEISGRGLAISKALLALDAHYW